MSSNLVKRLLRLSSEQPIETATERPKKRQRRHKDAAASARHAPVTADDIVASRVRQMLALDQTVAVKATTASKQELRRRQTQHEEQTLVKKRAQRSIVTNARSSALLSTHKIERTVSNKAHKKAKEEKALLSIAQKLKAIKKK